MEVTRSLARYVVNARYEELPAAVIAEGRRALLNWVGVAVGGSRHEVVETALRVAQQFSGPREASLLGRTEKLDIFWAALLNGISSHVFDFDDTHLKTVIHPAGPVASAVLALAERMPVSGRELLHAFILGIEVECRIGNAVYPDHYDVGWHITATTGVFGAAAAAGKLLGLNEEQMVHALGTAATQASGLREMFGSMCKPFHPGNAARNGLLAAFLAKEGFTSSQQGIEGRRAFGKVLSTKFVPEEVTEGLGSRYEILLNTYKPFSCGIVIHPAIDGCIQLRNAYGFKPEDVKRVDVKVHPLVLELTGKKTPQVGLEGKFSVYHSCAVAIIDGAARERQYSDAKVRDSRVIALRDKVVAEAVPGIAEAAAIVSVELHDGRVLTQHVEHAIGSVERPLTNADLEEKFRELADGILSADRTNALIDLLWRVETLTDATEIVRAAVAE